MQRAIDRQAEGIDGLPSTVPIAAHHCDQEQAKPPLPNFDFTDPELDDKYTAHSLQRLGSGGSPRLRGISDAI